MTFVLQVPETEELIGAVPRRRSFSDPFCFAVTKEAVYLATRKKGFVLWEPFETTRVPLASIRGVALYPARAAAGRIVLYSLLASLLAAGVLADFLRGRNLSFSLLFMTVVFMGSLIRIILGPRGRYCLQVDIWPEPLDFEPQLESVISAKAKAAELGIQTRFLDACQRVGLSVYRPTRQPIPDCPRPEGHFESQR